MLKNATLNATPYVPPAKFEDMVAQEKLWALQQYLQSLMQLDAQHVECKKEINAVMGAINKIMGI